MNVIRILDETTANKIAAGEVVERPSSIVKELIENAIDAGSTHIDVEIRDGGSSFIRVTDNGNGMSPTDARLAILRHATSKILTADDLTAVDTLGFRGEALPSIAAVSRFTLTTRRAEDQLAAYLSVIGGSLEDVREAGGGKGTTVTVEDLFFNTPARRKFLKSVASENSHIHDVLSRMALSRPDIAFKLTNNNKLVLATPGTGRLLDAAASLYGPRTAAELLAVEHEQDGIAVAGFIGKPTVLKSSRQCQTFTVNRRVVNSRMLSKALDNAYHSLLPKTGYPVALLHINLPADRIDVNVHPQKSEVKFSDDQSVFRAVYRSVVNTLTSRTSPTELAASVMAAPKEAFGGFDVRPSVIANREPLPDGSAGHDFYQPHLAGAGHERSALWQEEAVPFRVVQEQIAHAEDLTGIERTTTLDSDYQGLILRPLGQIDDCYIVAESGDSLYVIDQHAAHERILYDKFHKSAGIIPAQQLLLPLLIDMDEADIALIAETAPVWNELGFAIEQAGPELVRITELPADVPPSEASDMIREVLTYLHGHRQPSAGELRHTIIEVAACRAAVKAGSTLTMRQMQALLNELCATDLSYTCPHGRPAMLRFSSKDLAKMFKRT